MEEKSANNRTGDRIAIGGDYQYNAFYNAGRLQRSWHRFKISTAIRNISIAPGQKILDAGCGSGILSAFIAKNNPSVQVTGLDANADAIAFCQRQWKDLPNLVLIKGPIDGLQQFADEEMDAIAFLEVIEHITGPQANHVLSQFYRILKKGGKLVISTPNRKSIWPLLELIMDITRVAPRLKHDQHEKLYSAGELEKLALSNGFLLFQKQRINFLAPWLAVFSEALAKKTHEWELRQTVTPGSLLLFTLVKP